jgi:hypothetical protein
MNKAIANKLSDGYRALYAIEWNKLGYTLQNSLRHEVRNVRRELKSTGKDKLDEKLARWGNAGAWASYQVRELNKIIFNSKKPPIENLGDWVSVEIELIFNSEESEENFIKFIKDKGYRNFVTVKNDGSIRPNDSENEKAREIIVTFNRNNPQVLIDLCQALNEAGCYVNKSCGLHVHFDMRHVEHKRSVSTAAKRIAQCVDALKLMLPKSRRDNQFCRDKINTYTKGSRYAFVNLQSYQKHKTLEIRGHSGTTDASKILNWIKVLIVIMNNRSTQEVRDIYTLVRSFNFGPELSTYILERFTKFNKEDAQGDDVLDDNVA